MKLDDKFLQELIEESLQELQQEEVEKEEKEPEEESKEEKAAEDEEEIPGMDDVHDAFKDLQDKVKELEAKLEGKKEDEPEQMNESFQITKGRLREIIAEEMKKAKEQGLI